MISNDQLRQMMPNAGGRLDAHLPFINPAMDEGGIKTPKVIAAFLAQLAHESGEYRFMEEIWGPTEAQRGYEGRADLGNTQTGDGQKFMGHGPIQITGRANHKACGEALGLDLINDPKLITKPEHGTRAAVWFWNSRRLSLPAGVDWFKTITRIINGGHTGLADRVQYWNRNRTLLGLPLVNLDNEKASIEAFQAAHGLKVDGDAGRFTFDALAKA